MRIAAAVFASGIALAFAAPATAAVIIQSGVSLDTSPAPPHLSNKIGDDAVPNGTTLNLPDETGNIVAFAANDGTVLAHSGNGGFAGVFAANGLGFGSLTIDPVTKDGFTKINFNPAAMGQGNNTYYADFILDVLDGTDVTFQNVAIKTNGQNHFAISSNDNRIFSSLTLANFYTTQANTVANAARFANIDQVSIDLADAPDVPAAVPEPATWLMMMLGFGAMGGMLRRQRRTQMRFAPNL